MNRIINSLIILLKKQDVYLCLFIGAVLLSIGIPLSAYICNFQNSPFSSDPSDWASFGDYLGGTINTLASLLNLVIVIWVARNIYKLETQREQKLQAAALRPLCQFFITSYDDRLIISVKNLGNGPAKISQFVFEQKTDKGYITKTLNELIPYRRDIAEIYCTQIDGPTYLEAGGEINLITVEKKSMFEGFEQYLEKTMNDLLGIKYAVKKGAFDLYLEQVKDNLSSIEIIINYTDMFDNSMKDEKVKLLPIKTEKI